MASVPHRQRRVAAFAAIMFCAGLLLASSLSPLAFASGRPLAGDGLPAGQHTSEPSTSVPAEATPLPGTASVWGSGWNDADGDGERDAGESALSGVLVRAVSTDGQSTAVTAITGANGTYLIAGLLPNTYAITATPPAGYEATTRTAYSVALSEGDVLALNFGAQFVPTPTPSPTSPPVLDVGEAEQAYCGGVYRGNTATGKANVRSYSCRRAWDESGPEVVYRIEIDSSQLVTASLLTASADLDLFLLRYVYPDSCVAAGDTFLAHTAEAGVYLLAVDGYGGAAGSYELRVDCPEGVQATQTPTFTPSPTPTVGPSATPTATAMITPFDRRLYLPLLLQNSTASSAEY